MQLYTPVRCILLLMNVDSHLLNLLNLYDLSRSDEHSILGQEIIVIRLTLAYMQREFRNKLDFMDQAEQCEIFYLNLTSSSREMPRYHFYVQSCHQNSARRQVMRKRDDECNMNGSLMPAHPGNKQRIAVEKGYKLNKIKHKIEVSMIDKRR